MEELRAEGYRKIDCYGVAFYRKDCEVRFGGLFIETGGKMMTEKAGKLKDYLETVSHYDTAITLIGWDMDTEVPKNGMENLIGTLGFLSEKQFALKTSDEYGKLLSDLSEPEGSGGILHGVREGPGAFKAGLAGGEAGGRL